MTESQLMKMTSPSLLIAATFSTLEPLAASKAKSSLALVVQNTLDVKHMIYFSDGSRDENIQNNENSEYMKQLSEKMEVNVHFESSVDDALQIIRTKKYAKVKLITNGGAGLSGKSLIEQARKIIGSNFVCLVFAASNKHMEWVSKMENVLFTTSPSDFKTFAGIEMNKSSILSFANNLKKNYETDEYKFKINESQLLYFPKV